MSCGVFLQAVPSNVAMFGSVASSAPVASQSEPSSNLQSLQNLQDLAMLGFSLDHKMYSIFLLAFD